jgi:hypothetical protein
MEAVGFFETLLTVRLNFVMTLKIDMVGLSEMVLTTNQTTQCQPEDGDSSFIRNVGK